MNNNLNLVEILKNAATGTILYSTIYGNVKLVQVTSDPIYPIKLKNDTEEISVTITGEHFNTGLGECTLFPSKGQRNWSRFQSCKDGDILATETGAFIFKEFDSNGLPVAYCGINTLGSITVSDSQNSWTSKPFTYATHEQSNELCDKMTEQGLKWNTVSKQIVHDLPTDTAVMCRDTTTLWRLCYYAGYGKVYACGRFSKIDKSTVSYDYIVPVSKFSFEAGAENESKSIY